MARTPRRQTASQSTVLSPQIKSDQLPSELRSLRETAKEGREDYFVDNDNPFAYTPSQLSKMFDPKSLSAFYQLGDLAGLEKGLRTDTTAGLSVDEVREDDFVGNDNPFAWKPIQLSKIFDLMSLLAFYKLDDLAGLEKGLRTDTTAGLSVDEVESTTAKPKPRKNRRPRRRPRGASAVAEIEETLPLEPKCVKLNSIASPGLPNSPTTPTPKAVEACPLDSPGDGDVQTDDAEAEANFNTSDVPLLDRLLKTEIPTQPPFPGQSPATQRALRIQGDLGGVPASGIPDFGSEFNIISQSMVAVNQWLPDNDEDQCLYVLPDGNKKTFQGTITLPFCFEGESELWLCKFQILRDSIYPLLFGRSFLNKTDSMSKRRNRIKEVFISATSAIRRVLYVNQLSSIALSDERILGLINEEPIFGFADTCSDIPIIKRSAARQLGFTIFEGPEHTIEVQFIDGSTAWTTGTIKKSKWCFGVTSAPEDTWLIENLHVMDDIPCAMILDTWLLWDSDAFDRYRPDFRYDVNTRRVHRQEQLQNHLETRFGAVCTIQVVEKAVPAPDAYETPEAAKASQLIDAADDEVEKEEQALLARMVALAQQRQLTAVPVANGAPVADATAALPVERGWKAVFRRGRRRK